MVEANIMAALNQIDKKFFGQIFNVGSGKNISIKNIAKMISQDIEYLPQRQGEAKATLADIKKIKSVLDWDPKMNLENWIKKYTN